MFFFLLFLLLSFSFNFFDVNASFFGKVYCSFSHFLLLLISDFFISKITTIRANITSCIKCFTHHFWTHRKRSSTSVTKHWDQRVFITNSLCHIIQVNRYWLSKPILRNEYFGNLISRNGVIIPFKFGHDPITSNKIIQSQQLFST